MLPGKISPKFYKKRVLKSGLVVELVLLDFKKTNKYQEGVKYRLIAFYPKTNFRVLMDNHYPKSHHYHLDDKEFKYEFKNLKSLILDFKSLVYTHLGESL